MNKILLWGIFAMVCLTFFSNIYYQEVELKPNFQIREMRWCSDQAILMEGNGMSMFPYSWDFYYMEPIAWEDIKEGDIITYKKGDYEIHHVVINKYPKYLYTQGYNNPTRDAEAVFEEQILGVDCFMR